MTRTSLGTLLVGTLLLGCKTPESIRKDMLRDARISCEHSDAPSCLKAGELSREEPDGAGRAEKFFVRGCGLKNVASCDALTTLQGPARALGFAEACNAGDLVSCVRHAESSAKVQSGAADAKALVEQVCRLSTALKPDASVREVQGMGEACSKLALMTARGEGANADPLMAMKLEILAMSLRAEAARRLGKDDGAPSEKSAGTRETRPRTPALDAYVTLAEPGMKAMQDAMQGPAAPPLPMTAGEDILSPAMRRGSDSGAAKVPPAAAESKTPAKPAEGQAQSEDFVRCRDQGDLVSCAIAGTPLEKSDAPAALDLYVAACKKKPDACWPLLTHADDLFKHHEGARAVKALERGCDAKSATVCYRLGVELAVGERGLPTDAARGARMLDKACTLGSALGCSELSTMAEDGRGVGRDPGRAKQLHAKADALDKSMPSGAPPGTDVSGAEDSCRRAHEAARCVDAAMAVQDIDAVKAEELFRLGCAADKNSCTGLWAFAVDRMRKDDTGRGVRLLDQGCQDGAPLACVLLADVHRLGFHNVTRTETKATEAYQRACDLGDLYACRISATRTRNGIVVAKNPAKADELRDRALKMEDDAEAGRRAALEKWLTVAADLRARETYAQSLDRRRAEFWRLVGRPRLDVRAQPDPQPTDAASREESIRQMARTLLSANRSN